MHNVCVLVLPLCGCRCQAEMLGRIATGTRTDLESVPTATLLTMLATPIYRQQQPWASGHSVAPAQADTATQITYAVRVWTLMRALLEPELRGQWVLRQRPTGVVAFDLSEGSLRHCDVTVRWGVRDSIFYDVELTRLRTVRTNVPILPSIPKVTLLPKIQ